MLLDLSERELRARGLWPDPADTYADVNLIDGSDEMTITAVYKGLLDDSAESRQQIEHLLFRRMNFIYFGGLIARVPDAATNGKKLVVLLLLPDEEIPPTTLEMLQEYDSIIARRSFTLRVIQIPRDVL
jgi:hypothetical protein